jgi:anti-sigma regulatory factor (Ser/Thr protein kinase)
LGDRERGGWGVYFIKKVMDEVAYERHGDRNQLTMVKHLS